MAWLGLDWACELAAARGRRASRHQARWLTQRDLLAADIRSHGIDEVAGCCTVAYGSTEVAAALLLLPIVGFESPTSPRVTAPVEAVQQRLCAGGPLLYRYLEDDALPGREGAFLPCSFWLVQALATVDRRCEAEELLYELVALGSPLGPYPEEMDPSTGEHLGNYRQALTHAALVQAAFALDHCRSPADTGREGDT